MIPLSALLQAQGPSNQQAPGLLIPGNIPNLYNRPVMQNPNQTWSTTRSMSFQDDMGREVLVPTVVNGVALTDRQAIDRYYRTGQHLGIFANPQAADAYATALHNSQQAMGNFYGPRSR